METIDVTFAEVMQLEAEISGVSDEKGTVVQKGLLNEKLPLVTKYWLVDLLNKISPIKKRIDSLREDLIKTHGDVNADGNIVIPIYEGDSEPKKINAKFVAFKTEYDKLLQEKESVQYKPFMLDDLKGVESENNFVMFMKLVKINVE